MSSYYKGVEPQVYEITWMAGHIEQIRAHEVTTRRDGGASGRWRIKFHAENPDGEWVLTLSALEDDIRTIRNVTAGEPLPRGPGGEG